jgi:hypothetical protein
MGVLRERREAMDLVRKAYSDVAEAAHITGETTANLRKAHQISELVFSKKISDRLKNLAATAWELETAGRSFKPKTEKDVDAEHRLRDEPQKTLDAMQSEAALRRWF